MLLKLGTQNNTVATIQEWLNFLGYRYESEEGNFEKLVVDGIYGEKTESAVMDFQEDQSLLVDGIVGPNTMKALENAYSMRNLEITSPGIDYTDAQPDRYPLERVYADSYDEGYTRMNLRGDVKDAYNNARQEIINQGGLVTSSGSMRSLKAKVSPNRSATSFHYLGLAFDLYIFSGMIDPKKDPYVLQLDGDRHFKVWARCSKDWDFHEKDTPNKIELPPTQKIDGIITYKNRDPEANQPVEDHFLNVTEIFEKNGFQRIGARKRFFQGVSRLAAEWWHFQHTKGLVEGVSYFGNELLKIYSEETVEGTPPWDERNRVFGVNWF